MKKVRKVGMGVSPPFAVAASHGGMEARARNKYQGLLLDYEDLLKEIESKKDGLQKAQKKKVRLSAEVKFLRRKYKRLSKNSSYRLKKRSQKSLPNNTSLKAEIQSKDRNYQAMEASNITAVLDLNEAFLPNGEEMEELQMEQEHPKAIANDLKLSICRDVETSGNRVGKRKISWQDQVALRV